MLSIAEVAERLGVSRWTIAREIEDGALAAIPIRDTYRIDPADLESYIARQKQAVAASIAARKAAAAPSRGRGRGRPKKAALAAAGTR